MTDQPPLAVGLAAEHAVIFAYGPIGARLEREHVGLARDADSAHRARRDALLLRLAEQGVTPPAAAASYTLPFAVTDAADALRLAVHVEERTAGVWRSLLAYTEADERQLALDALVDCAVRATEWRMAAGIDPVTRVYPGLV